MINEERKQLVSYLVALLNGTGLFGWFITHLEHFNDGLEFTIKVLSALSLATALILNVRRIKNKNKDV